MKRDMDLVRQILLTIEEYDGPLMRMKDFAELHCANDELFYHLRLLHDGGFIDGTDAQTKTNCEFYVRAMTWDGHEFLDAARDHSRWEQAKEIAGKAGTITIEVLTKVLTQLCIKAVEHAMIGI